MKRLQNQITLNRDVLPEKEQMMTELVTAQVEFKVCEQELRLLEKAVEDASDPNRLRLLPGENPTRNELSDRLDKVEVVILVVNQEDI